MWRFGCENWGSRRGRSGMVSVTGLFQAQVPWIAWKGCYLWVLSLKQARHGDHARSASKKSPILGLSPPPLQHSLQSAKCSELPTATFLFLSNWENKSINAYRALVRDIPKYCTTLGFIPKTKLTYAMLTSWKGVQRYFPNHTWTWILLLSGTNRHNSV